MSPTLGDFGGKKIPVSRPTSSEDDGEDNSNTDDEEEDWWTEEDLVFVLAARHDSLLSPLKYWMSLETWFISFNKRVDIFHSPLSTSQLELESWGWLKSSAQITPLAFCLQHHFPWMLTFYDQSYFPVFNIIIWNKCSDGRYYWPDFPQSDSPPCSYVYCLPCLWLTCVVWSASLPGTNISTTQYHSSSLLYPCYYCSCVPHYFATCWW